MASKRRITKRLRRRKGSRKIRGGDPKSDLINGIRKILKDPKNVNMNDLDNLISAFRNVKHTPKNHFNEVRYVIHHYLKKINYELKNNYTKTLSTLKRFTLRHKSFRPMYLNIFFLALMYDFSITYTYTEDEKESNNINWLKGYILRSFFIGHNNSYKGGADEPTENDKVKQLSEKLEKITNAKFSEIIEGYPGDGDIKYNNNKAEYDRLKDVYVKDNTKDKIDPNKIDPNKIDPKINREIIDSNILNLEEITLLRYLGSKLLNEQKTTGGLSPEEYRTNLKNMIGDNVKKFADFNQSLTDAVDRNRWYLLPVGVYMVVMIAFLGAVLFCLGLIMLVFNSVQLIIDFFGLMTNIIMKNINPDVPDYEEKPIPESMIPYPYPQEETTEEAKLKAEVTPECDKEPKLKELIENIKSYDVICQLNTDYNISTSEHLKIGDFIKPNQCYNCWLNRYGKNAGHFLLLTANKSIDFKAKMIPLPESIREKYLIRIERFSNSSYQNPPPVRCSGDIRPITGNNYIKDTVHHPMIYGNLYKRDTVEGDVKIIAEEKLDTPE